MTEGILRLGRRHQPDNRDCLYPASLVLETMSTARRVFPWKRSRNLNQEDTGTCVGHGWRGWYEAEPVTHLPDEGPDAFTIYRQAVLLDGFSDNDFEATAPIEKLQEGTTVRAGAKAMQNAGLIGSYVWASKAAQIADFVTRVDGSPVVMGTNWYRGMFDPDKDGRVRFTGGIAGGHCWDIFWWDGHDFWCVTSWGEWGIPDYYGIRGCFKLSVGQVARLLRENGEACMGVERVLQAAV